MLIIGLLGKESIFTCLALILRSVEVFSQLFLLLRVGILLHPDLVFHFLFFFIIFIGIESFGDKILSFLLLTILLFLSLRWLLWLQWFTFFHHTLRSLQRLLFFLNHFLIHFFDIVDVHFVDIWVILITRLGFAFDFVCVWVGNEITFCDTLLNVEYTLAEGVSLTHDLLFALFYFFQLFLRLSDHFIKPVFLLGDQTFPVRLLCS